MNHFNCIQADPQIDSKKSISTTMPCLQTLRVTTTMPPDRTVPWLAPARPGSLAFRSCRPGRQSSWTRGSHNVSHTTENEDRHAPRRVQGQRQIQRICVYIYIYVVLERQAFDFVCILILNYSDGLMFCLSSFRAFV